MLLTSHAKINLYLEVGKKLRSGYHNIRSVMQLIELHDNISFGKLNEDSIAIESSNKELESRSNLAYKAALLLKNKFSIKEGIKIAIEKQIPIASGLGGGSSNAANALIALNSLWRLGLTQKKLISLALEIGSDVPFFIVGESALVEGVGDKIKPLQKPLSANLVLVNPGIKVSTAWAYKEFDRNKPKEKHGENAEELIRAIGKKDIKTASKNLYNDFEPVVGKKFKIVKEVKASLKKFGALNSIMSGSGPTVLGLFDSIYTAREAYFKLRDMYPFVYLTKTF